MQHLKSKAVVAAIAGLLIVLPEDEGVRHKPYKDIAGIVTVCYGHTGNDIVWGKEYTEKECLSLLEKDLERHTKKVLSCMQHEAVKEQLIAYIGFDYNTGAWCSSRSAALFNQGKFGESCEALAHSPSGRPVWSYINGSTYVPGLYARRLRERNMCYKGLYAENIYNHRDTGGIRFSGSNLIAP